MPMDHKNAFRLCFPWYDKSSETFYDELEQTMVKWTVLRERYMTEAGFTEPQPLTMWEQRAFMELDKIQATHNYCYHDVYGAWIYETEQPNWYSSYGKCGVPKVGGKLECRMCGCGAADCCDKDKIWAGSFKFKADNAIVAVSDDAIIEGIMNALRLKWAEHGKEPDDRGVLEAKMKTLLAKFGPDWDQRFLEQHLWEQLNETEEPLCAADGWKRYAFL